MILNLIKLKVENQYLKSLQKYLLLVVIDLEVISVQQDLN